MMPIPPYLRNGVVQKPTDTLHPKFIAKNPKTGQAIHENKSQGVLYEFRQSARVWKERQKRCLCVGGPMNGEMRTRWEIESGKYPTFYKEYKAGSSGYTYPTIWAYVGENG